MRKKDEYDSWGGMGLGEVLSTSKKKSPDKEEAKRSEHRESKPKPKQKQKKPAHTFKHTLETHTTHPSGLEENKVEEVSHNV
jgi:hypothetical protein